LVAALIWSEVTKKPPRQSVRVPNASAASPSGIDGQFSAWDGSHRKLTQTIKRQLNDPRSYEHIATAYGVVDGEVVVNVRFRAKNSRGVRVINEVLARASADGNGDDITIYQWKNPD
jgi:hypothetical protein